MKRLKTFENYSDDDDFSMKSVYLGKIRSYYRKLDATQTVSEVNELIKDIEEYEGYCDLSEVEGEWEDLKVLSDRKKEEIEEKETGLPKEVRELIDKHGLDKLINSDMLTPKGRELIINSNYYKNQNK